MVTDTVDNNSTDYRKRDWIGHDCLACGGALGQDGLDPVNLISCVQCGYTLPRYMTKAEWVALHLTEEQE